MLNVFRFFHLPKFSYCFSLPFHIARQLRYNSSTWPVSWMYLNALALCFGWVTLLSELLKIAVCIHEEYGLLCRLFKCICLLQRFFNIQLSCSVIYNHLYCISTRCPDFGSRLRYTAEEMLLKQLMFQIKCSTWNMVIYSRKIYYLYQCNIWPQTSTRPTTC